MAESREDKATAVAEELNLVPTVRIVGGHTVWPVGSEVGFSPSPFSLVLKVPEGSAQPRQTGLYIAFGVSGQLDRQSRYGLPQWYREFASRMTTKHASKFGSGLVYGDPSRWLEDAFRDAVAAAESVSGFAGRVSAVGALLVGDRVFFGISGLGTASLFDIPSQGREGSAAHFVNRGETGYAEAGSIGEGEIMIKPGSRLLLCPRIISGLSDEVVAAVIMQEHSLNQACRTIAAKLQGLESIVGSTGITLLSAVPPPTSVIYSRVASVPTQNRTEIGGLGNLCSIRFKL